MIRAQELRVRDGFAPPRSKVLLRLLPPERDWLRARCGETAYPCSTDRELELAGRASNAVSGIICDASLVSPMSASTSPIRAALALGVPLLVRLSLCRADIGALIAAAQSDVDWRVSVRGLDDLTFGIDSLLAHGRVDDAVGAIIQRVGRGHASVRQEILFEIAAIGRFRLLARQFAEMRAQPLRTLEMRASAANLPPISVLLGWALALHTAFRMETLEWSAKRASHASGFATTAALAEYLRRHVGMRPAAMRTRGTFSTLLDRFADLIHSDAEDGSG